MSSFLKRSLWGPYVLLVLLHCWSNSCAAQKKKQAVLIGSSTINEAELIRRYNLPAGSVHYDDLKVPVSRDIDTMRSLLSRCHFSSDEILVLTNNNLTVAKIREHITRVAATLEKDALFILYFTGHGQPVPDAEPKDEADGMDEAFVLTSELWTDDSIQVLLKGPLSGFKNVFITDACYSGDGFKVAELGIPSSWLKRGYSYKPQDDFRKGVIRQTENQCPYFQDDSTRGYALLFLSASSSRLPGVATYAGGWLTQQLNHFSHDPDFGKMNFRQLYCLLYQRATKEDNVYYPEYTEVGDVSSYILLPPFKLKP